MSPRARRVIAKVRPHARRVMECCAQCCPRQRRNEGHRAWSERRTRLIVTWAVTAFIGVGMVQVKKMFNDYTRKLVFGEQTLKKLK